MLVTNCNTKSFSFQRVTPENLDQVYEVLKENIDIIKLFDGKPDLKIDARNFSNHTDIPPDGKKENLRNYILFQDSIIIGILGCYMGHPEKDILYIGNLFLKPSFRKKGVGSEVIELIEKSIATLQFTEIRLGVGLKNWGGLNFWLKKGFDKITKYSTA